MNPVTFGSDRSMTFWVVMGLIRWPCLVRCQMTVDEERSSGRAAVTHGADDGQWRRLKVTGVSGEVTGVKTEVTRVGKIMRDANPL